MLHPRLWLGTSAWSNRDWVGSVYPPGTAPRDYLTHSAARYRAVETDSTWYRTPSIATTRRWAGLLPEGFRMAAKCPRVITHEKTLTDCGADLAEFLAAIEPLGDRIGPLLLQFPYFNRASGMTAALFRDRLAAFLPTLPADRRFAVEVRNRTWLEPALIDLLGSHRVALTIVDHPWMPSAASWRDGIDPVTTDFVYIRWIGDRHGIERVTRTWDRCVVDRTHETADWVEAVRDWIARDVTVYGFFNNHYAGHAPGSIALFERLWGDVTAS